MTDSNTTATTMPVLETFNVNPYANNINPSTDSGSKLYMKATEPLSKAQQLETSMDNGMNVRNHLERQRHRFAWGKLLSKVPDSSSDLKDNIRNYRSLSIENVLIFNNTHLGAGTSTDPPKD